MQILEILEILEIVVHAVHLLVIGVGVCLPLVLIVLSRKVLKLADEGHQQEVWAFCVRLLKHSLIAILIGSMLGFALAGVIWSEDYHARCHLVMNKFKWGAIEWLFSMVLFAAVLSVWKKGAGKAKAFWVRSLVLVIASLNLLYHMPLLFMVIAEIPDDMVRQLTDEDAQLSSAQFRQLVSSASILSRWIHASMAMLTVAMAYVAIQGIRRANQVAEGVGRDAGISICRWAARNVLLLLFSQIAFGIWTVVAMPGGRMQNLMGGVVPATILFGLSILLLFVQLQQWTGLLGERVQRTKLVQAVATLITMFICMVAMSVLS